MKILNPEKLNELNRQFTEDMREPRAKLAKEMAKARASFYEAERLAKQRFLTAYSRLLDESNS